MPNLKLIPFLKKLEKTKIHFSLSYNRDEAVTVEIVVPGQRWEVEFFEKGEVEIEKFKSDGTIFNESALKDLFKDFSD